MRILFVSPFDFGATGGVNEHIIQLDRQFQAMGHETRILAPTSAQVGEQDDGHIYRLGVAMPIPSNGSMARVTLSPFIINKVRQFLEREHFDVIHLHEPLAPVLPLAVLLFSKSANVGTFHAARTNNLFYLYTKAALDMFHSRLDAKIAVSEPALEYADSHFPGQYEIIPNGVSIKEFSNGVEPLPHLMDGRKNILFMGRYNEPRKGFRYLIRAYPMVRQQFPESRLIVVGAGDQERYERFLYQHDMHDVMFEGYTAPEIKPRYYASADVFCAPSTGRESFGMVLVEAMASGAPVVASAIPGYQGVVTHGETGLTVEPKNSQSLAMGLVRVLADTDLRNRITTNALEHVRQFDWERVASRVKTVYDMAIQSQSASAPRSSNRVPASLVASDG